VIADAASATTRVRPGKRAFAIGGGALLLFAVGTNVQAGWVLVVAALLLGILAAGLILPLTALRGVEVSRRAPARATAGEPVPVTLAVDNASRGLRGMFRVTDDFCGLGWAYVGAVGAGTRREFIGVRTGARRGVHTDGTCTVETGAPFGVLQVRRTSSVASPIVVHPRVYPVPDRMLAGRADWPAPAATGDVSSVRDYRPGDPLRHVHWRSVAKRGRLVVREFDREHLVDTAVIARLPDDLDTGDAIASVACSFAVAMLRGGDVQLIGTPTDRGGSGGLPPTARGGSGGLHPMGETLVTRTRSSDRVLDWGAHLASGGASLGELAGDVRGATTVVCVCDAGSVDVAELARLGGRAALHVVLVTGTRDDVADLAAAVARVRGTGASVVAVRADAIAEWFEAGAPL
jgi:hypothetical protein